MIRLVRLPTESTFRIVFETVVLLQEKNNEEFSINQNEFKFIKNYKPLIEILQYGIPGIQEYDFFKCLAFIFRDLLKRHYLTDGNKRFAWFFCVHYLKLNNYERCKTDAAGIKFCEKITKEEEIDISLIATLLKKHFKMKQNN